MNYGPLKKPTATAIEVFEKTLEQNPDADMRPIPNEWLLRERGISSKLGLEVDDLRSKLSCFPCAVCGRAGEQREECCEYGRTAEAWTSTLANVRKAANLLSAERDEARAMRDSTLLRLDELTKDIERGFMPGAYARLKWLHAAEAELTDRNEQLKGCETARKQAFDMWMERSKELDAVAQLARDGAPSEMVPTVAYTEVSTLRSRLGDCEKERDRYLNALLEIESWKESPVVNMAVIREVTSPALYPVVEKDCACRKRLAGHVMNFKCFGGDECCEPETAVERQEIK